MTIRGDDHIRAACFHPSGNFVDFSKSDVETSIPHRFKQIVDQYPQRVAVKCGDRTITFDELNRKAEQLAQTIARADNKAHPIALYFEPGIEVVSAILGVLKAGRCYLPLDPSFPESRLQSMLEDSQAELLVTDRNYGMRLSQEILTNIRVLYIDDFTLGVATSGTRIYAQPDMSSFIIYTSGSTGKPKGVLHTHRTVLHTVMSLTNLVHLCPEDRVALLMSYNFSASIRQLFGALLNGATLLPFDIKKKGFAHLLDWIEHEGITMCGLTGSMFRQFLAHMEGNQGRGASLRVCFVGSESVSKNDIELYKKFMPDQTIIATNMGLNETGGIANLLIDKHTEIRGSIVPAGYPADDKEIILVNESGKQVGFNTPGEIVVKSEFLSPGYWRMPELTSAKFFVDANDGRRRGYKTGDLGLMTPDGCLHYRGRIDNTVKIRGYNVEPPKIEMALLEHRGVKQSAVVTRKNRNGDVKLTAYIVPACEPGPSSDELQNLLKKSLPDYMIPSLFVVLNELPVTPTGKIDRNALPEPPSTRPQLEIPYTSYRNETEKLLTDIWEEALAIKPVGVYDNFFTLGGDSLIASGIVSGVIRRFRLAIPLKSLFESPTIAKMAEAINSQQVLDTQGLTGLLQELEELSEEDAKRLVSANCQKSIKS